MHCVVNHIRSNDHLSRKQKLEKIFELFCKKTVVSQINTPQWKFLIRHLEFESPNKPIRPL